MKKDVISERDADERLLTCPKETREAALYY